MPEIKKDIPTDNKTKDNEDGYIASLGIIVKSENDKIVVDDILDDSDAFVKGVKSGNIIYKINDKEITSFDDIEAYVDYSVKNGNEIIKMEMISEGCPRTLNVRIVNDDKN